MQTIAILGGGPAGAFTGELLATAGFPVTIVDEKLAWEKPCGGGLTAKALDRYPFLSSADVPRKLVERAVLVASNGARTVMRLRRPLAIYSRQVLNGLLLDRARRSGASVVKDRVVAASRHNGAWRLDGKQGRYDADFCVVATGARNPFREMGASLSRDDAYVALGYYVPGQQDHIEIQFLKRLEGYIWVFPRSDHLSVGICGKIGSDGTPRLRRVLEDYMARHGIPIEGSTFYCHLLPSLTAKSFDRQRVAGEGWAAVGDAAGLVDPVTGEGLYYALRSAELLAGCVRDGRSVDYSGLVWNEITRDLRIGAGWARRLYHGRFLLGSVTTRMIEFCRRSPTFQNLMQDLIAGNQGYVGLKARLLRQLSVSLAEIALYCLQGRTTDPHEPDQIPRPV
jgi:flavin-dependent dehydrogenase